MSVDIQREPSLTTKRDPELTRRRLMEAATKLFAEKGRDGTSVDEICQASGVNCRMIYHYFGSKDGLYMAMLERVYGGIHEIAVEADARSKSLSDFIEALTERYFRFLQANPEFVAVLRWENASGAEGIRQLDLDDFRSKYFGAASRVLDRQDGQSSTTENSLLIILTCCSLCGHYFSNQASLSYVLGVELADPEFAERWLAHIKRVALAMFCD
ncbi:unnamed protein product [marine sediment metagenome]|uniref:HTH tetR-type domain-containing protein n=1 Tax=marine sediment metagenome TaxID=412755 RepID=X0SYQ5_9ZZZZ